MVQLLIKKTNQPKNLEKSIGDWFRRLFGGTKSDKKTVFKKTSPVSHMFPDLYSEPITEKPLLYKKNDQGIMEATLSKQEHDEWEKLIKKITDGFFRRKVNEHFKDSEKSDKWIRQSLGNLTERQDVARSKKIIQDFLEKIIPAHKVQIPSSIESSEDYLKKLFTEEQQKSIYDMIPDLPMKAKFPELLPNDKANTTEPPVIRNAWNDTQSLKRATDANLVPEDFQDIKPTGRDGAWSLADVDAAIARKNTASVVAQPPVVATASVVAQPPVVATAPVVAQPQSTSAGAGQSLPSPIRTPRVLTDSERRGLNSNYDTTLGTSIHDFIDRFIVKVIVDADESGDSFQKKSFILEKLRSLSATAKNQPKGMSGIPAADFAVDFWKLCNSTQFNALNIGKTKTDFQAHIEDSFLRKKRQIEIDSPLNQKWSEGDITEVLADDKQSEKITKHPQTGKDEALIVDVFRPKILQNGKQIIAPFVALGKIPSLSSSIDSVPDQGNSGISNVEGKNNPANSASVTAPTEPTSVTPTNPLPFEMTINANKSKGEFKKFGESIADYATISRIKTNGSNQTHQISYQPKHYDKILEEMQKHPTLNSQAILFEKHGVGSVESPKVVPPPEINFTRAKDEADDFF